MKVRIQKDTNIRRFLAPTYFQPYLDSFVKDLSQQGYTVLTITNYYKAISHFGVWIHKRGISLKDVDYDIFATFAEHLCHCPGGRKIKKVSRQYLVYVRCFTSYLHQQGVINFKNNSTYIPVSSILVKF